MPSAVCRPGRFPAALALLVFVLPSFAADPDSVVLDRMKKDLYYLAGPECMGRASGSKEIEKAADYVAAQFKTAGLKPAAKDGSYFQPFTVNLRGTTPIAPTGLRLTGPD